MLLATDSTAPLAHRLIMPRMRRWSVAIVLLLLMLTVAGCSYLRDPFMDCSDGLTDAECRAAYALALTQHHISPDSVSHVAVAEGNPECAGKRCPERVYSAAVGVELWLADESSTRVVAVSVADITSAVGR